MRKIANWCKTAIIAIAFSGTMHNAEAREVAEMRDLTETYGTADPATKPVVSLDDAALLARHTEQVYRSINFAKGKKLSKDVFTKAYHGYLNLKQSGQLDDKRAVISICDFSLSANVPRLWVIDLESKKVLFHTLVAHGQGSGEEFATAFSNVEGSHQSSMGFFVTANTYYGDKGYSLKLEGKDAGFNCQAFSRAIVIHAADYVSYDFIKANQRLGRSWGCPALPVAANRPIIDAIKGGTTLFIYTENKKYLASSKWLKKYPNIDASELIRSKDENTMLADVPSVKLSSDTIAKPRSKTKFDPGTIPVEAYFN